MKKKTRPTNQVPTDDVMDARRAQFGRHLYPYALRRTAVPTVLADQPEFVALEVERRDTLAAEARISRVHDELVSRNELARSEYQEAQRRRCWTAPRRRRC